MSEILIKTGAKEQLFLSLMLISPLDISNKSTNRNYHMIITGKLDKESADSAYVPCR